MKFLMIPANKKGPKDEDWGKHGIDWTTVQAKLSKNPRQNVGLIMGPINGIIDFECDSDLAAENLLTLIPADLRAITPTWSAKKGNHYLFLWDDRLNVLKGVEDLQGVACRLGASGKQVQSVCPPSIVDGARRKWINELGPYQPQPLPELVIALLLALPKSTSVSVDQTPDPLFAGLGLAKIAQDKLVKYCEKHNLPISGVTSDHIGRIKINLTYCPIRGPQHTDGAPAFLIGNDGSRKFSCFHAKCAGKDFTDIESLFGELTPKIKVSADTPTMLAQAIDSLSDDSSIYQRAGMLVELTTDTVIPPQCLNDNGATKLRQIPLPILSVKLAGCARWIKGKKRTTPPPSIVQAVDSSTHFPLVAPITGIVSCPIVRQDGSILSTMGYDKATGLYADIDNSYPPLLSVSDSLDSINDILSDFPFATPAHKSGWLALLLTMVSRHAFAGSSPLFLVDATASRTGKGLATDLITLITEGRCASRFAAPTSDEETRKLITSCAIAGRSYLIFDNITKKLGGASLENAITTTNWADRILGKNREIDLPLKIVFLATGNNVSLTTDMVGRTCHIRLETSEERPEQRTNFKHPNLTDYVKSNRAKLAMAAVSIVSQFIKSKNSPKLAGWGGFDQWSNLVRGAIVWAGWPDPAEARETLRESADDESEDKRNLIIGWAELGSPMTVARAMEIVTTTGKAPTLGQLVDSLPGDKKHSLGQLLRRHKGAIINGRRLHKIGDRWQVM